MRNAGLFEIYLFVQRYIIDWGWLVEWYLDLIVAGDLKCLIFSWMCPLSAANCVD